MASSSLFALYLCRNLRCVNGKITCRIIVMGKRKIEGHSWGCVILVVEMEIEIRLIIITYSMLNQND